MSQRTILEVNHDIAKVNPGDSARFVAAWDRAIASGSPESWLELERWGVRRVTQCHHSEDRKLIVGNGGLRREYPIG